eukprot:gene8200-28_t
MTTRKFNGEEKETNKKIKMTEPHFKTPFLETRYGHGDFPAIPVIQLKQSKFTQEIVSKPKWYEKIKDEKIVEKWKKEILKNNFNNAMINFTFDELDYYINTFSKNSDHVIVSPIYSIYQVDELIPKKLSNEFKKNALKLENLPEEQLDWHPGSNNQVLDLVHPSLFPFVYGKSLITKQPIQQSKSPMFEWIGKGEILKSNIKHGQYRSEEFQWLPADVDVSNDGKIKFLSYINNLHPYERRELYGNISRILEKFIPLFENVLTDSVNSNDNIQKIDMYDLYDKPNSEDDLDEYYVYRRPNWVPFNTTFKPNSIENKINLKGRKLQIIVKMANILLTPENPNYEGGVWHVEGMENEDIVATGIYYYDNENISNSKLHFRQSVLDPDYEQGDHEGVGMIYELFDEGPMNQQIGYITSQSERCIAFPNIYQHKVSPFKLEDSTKNGHRKILVFFLVNPKNDIISTARVPPQQKEWWKKILASFQCFGNIPREVCEIIIDFMEFPIELKETKEDRLRMMDERKYVSSNIDEEHYLREFSLCEH